MGPVASGSAYPGAGVAVHGAAVGAAGQVRVGRVRVAVIGPAVGGAGPVRVGVAETGAGTGVHVGAVSIERARVGLLVELGRPVSRVLLVERRAGEEGVRVGLLALVARDVRGGRARRETRSRVPG